ncbi:putative porin [Pseudomonas cichorii]|uniref:Porin n=1 Tax=Pseudomonas lijiangensis TaxID=2995658 RepID=A0ABX8HNF4_9PSED|nr:MULTISPECIES: putative porin [Pseudomonas syringae group]MBX8499827.1 putative porin [Pseudomonas lijiangensis]MBX8503585.1 putative porin [Pseudomonas lijiangensis]MBX8509604.1 putative porin [Pseudomonas cichorii]MBX8519544.1 putative porin [Pseudomonas cichorii]MBX8524919.1 putative porin [Pseudomonas cichorii]
MRLVSTRTAAALSGSLALAMSVGANAAVDAKLLDMLRANGSINQAQYAELQTELAKDQQAQKQALADVQQSKSASQAEFEKKIAWATKTQFKGDVRVRQETINIDGQTNAQDKDRQRIRARLGAYTEINPQVSTGIRIATGGSSDARSTNQDLDGYFVKKDLWLDLGYIDYAPTAVKDLHVIGGKMNQPWVSMGDVIWDNDINPEGLAATYKLPLGGKTELFGSAGHYTLKDNIDGDGTQFRHDLTMYAGQLGARFAPTDDLKVTLGGSVYGFRNDKDSAALRVNGNTTNQFRLYEGFGQIDISGLGLPLALYGQYVVNNDSTDDQDTAWLTGVKTKVFGFNLDYNYRDTQRNAVVGAFTDSDFANGTTGSRGHKLKVGYEIDKNFSVGATYFLTQADYATSTSPRDSDVKTLQLDVEAKF